MNEDLQSLYLKLKNYTEALEKNKPNQEDEDRIFSEFLAPIIEYYWFLVQRFSLKELLDKLERLIIISALTKCDANQKKTAILLRLNPSTLYEKVKKHNISFHRDFYCSKNENSG